MVAPLRMHAADIAAFVEHNRAWIDAKLGAVQRVLAAHPGSGRLIDGSAILYRGRPARLRVRAGAKGRVHEDNDLEVTVPAALTDADQESGGRARAAALARVVGAERRPGIHPAPRAAA